MGSPPPACTVHIYQRALTLINQLPLILEQIQSTQSTQRAAYPSHVVVVVVIIAGPTNLARLISALVSKPNCSKRQTRTPDTLWFSRFRNEAVNVQCAGKSSTPVAGSFCAETCRTVRSILRSVHPTSWGKRLIFVCLFFPLEKCRV